MKAYLEVEEIQRVLSGFRKQLSNMREDKRLLEQRLASLWEAENAWQRERKAAGEPHPTGHHRVDFDASVHRLEAEISRVGWCIACLDLEIERTLRSELDRFHEARHD